MTGENLLLVINTKARETGDRLALLEYFQAYDALALLVGQHVLVVGEARLGQTHHDVRLHVVRRNQLVAHKALEIYE